MLAAAVAPLKILVFFKAFLFHVSPKSEKIKTRRNRDGFLSFYHFNDPSERCSN